MEKRLGFIINSIYALIIAGIVYLVFKYAIFVVMPFLLGFAVAALINPVVRFLSRRYDLKRRPAGIMLLLLFYATIGMLITIGVVRLTVLFGEFSGELPFLYRDKLEPALNKLFGYINSFADRLYAIFGGESQVLSERLGGIFTSIKSSLGDTISDISVKALTRLSSAAAAIPGIIIELLFAVISSFFFTVDYENILSLAKRLLPKRTVDLLCRLRGRVFKVAGKYLRSYALILLITFGELSLGLVLLGVDNAVLIAFCIALFDILPVAGTGGIMIPWAILSLIGGDWGFAVGLVVIWAVITIVRNIIEPKIVGRQVGLHPLLALIAMFVGTKLFGLVGLFLLPLTLAIVLPLLRERFVSERETVETPEDIKAGIGAK
ncbi:MAG TPA: sporulation integral membrane protein YtvI [Firmicutes bacterium]|nr:sporulation integral membrane protein YtvI [Bacillota bacterium]